MTDDPPLNPALLPAGFVDVLPPAAEAEADGLESLMRVFAAHGYDRVSPPLLEFEETLLTGSGAAVAEQTFRVMDPDTRRMMALRPDMTPQIARIAATRLARRPRPLRLSYAGACVMMGSPSRETDRQILQAGIELIGPDTPVADAEIVALGAEGLKVLGVPNVSFDLTMPPLTTALLAGGTFTPATRSALLRALDRKDAAAVARYGGALAPILTELLYAAGPARRALEVLSRVSLPPAARAQSDRLAATVATIEERVPGIRLTVDPVEFRGWQYHTGVCVTVYALGRQEELGRGGRYRSNDDEPACGLTLRPDTILRVAPPRESRTRVFVPWGTEPEVAQDLRTQGYATVAALGEMAIPVAEAQRLGCAFIVSRGKLKPVRNVGKID
ncbi:ATP phosphoribosyltransferase regulatory subunit [Novacetimonas pomaceti]|uniref:ATP phosphoribosyltransferase regulatory subunit n=1 Tax=Novacetimonas pomaceti TaxID=2021998 RepID=A0A318QD15_9PROT|nr:ATP phosphoribosyltransferase regulatory subunit [Novacetimonas pomaceti]MBV1832794.1 ATP phosphoribosyltransferase regulatory subunit [Novacetimonas pomaceti]PYD48972.1 ATP phosphoribosyltransferase regulatory subunit [Novacetimonas pomaceti]PYD76480.1 ATP phosphoribosyltransferase regulatory subunit [Novacetimonas pomaceti]